MKTIKLYSILILIIIPIITIGQSENIKTKLTTQLDSLSYALGVYCTSPVKQSGITDIDINLFIKGFVDVLNNNEGVMTMDQALNLLNSYSEREKQKLAAENLRIGQKFLEENAKKPGIQIDPSGIQYKIISKGSGPKPLPTDVVKVHYHGTKIDGTIFDSSVDRGSPTEFPLNRVIKGWTIGVGLMNVGSKYILYIPSELAYGTNPRQGGPIKPNEVLIFEVELLEIKPGGK
jgi:FKBP-type peptidyl-prolyl cis-trans isomerase